MSVPGFTKAWRKELESDIWRMPPLYYRVWHFLIQSVSWEKNIFPTRNKFGIHLNPGQQLLSIQQIVDGVSWVERNVVKKPNKKTVMDILKWLSFHDMIVRESNGNGTFVSICNWCRYQSAEKTKVTESIPQSIPQGIPQGVNTKEGKEVKEEKKQPSSYSEKFEIFWKAYPSKNGKFKAFSSWKKYNCENGIFDSIMESLEAHKQSKRWMKDNGRYIPNGSTWVNGKGWEDETETTDEWG